MNLEEHTRGMLTGAFVGDALALGPHWVYDRQQILQKFGRIAQFQPPATTYHPGKKAGDLTHIGDQMLILERSIRSTGGEFSASDFMRQWIAFWQAPATQSYKDKATKAVLANLAAGKLPNESASHSTELAGPARGIPVLAAGLLKGAEEATLVSAIQAQTQLTHYSPEALEVAAFLAHLFAGLTLDLSFEAALSRAVAASSTFVGDCVRNADAPRLTSLSTGDAVEALGQSCDSAAALPAAILMIRRHGDDFATALIDNAMAGGDSAARGIIVGAVLGWQHGLSGIPAAWISGLNQAV